MGADYQCVDPPMVDLKKVALDILSTFGELIELEEFPEGIEGLTYPKGIKGHPSLRVFLDAQYWEVKQFLHVVGIERDSSLIFHLSGITIIGVEGC